MGKVTRQYTTGSQMNVKRNKKRSRSIKHRLERARSAETKREILHEWSDEWLGEYIDWVNELKNAIDDQDMTGIKISLAQLRKLTEDKHKALHNIFDLLLDSNEHRE